MTNNMKTSLGNMADVTKVFNKFDTNGDGKISKEELKAVLELLGSHATTHEVDDMMADMDKDGDGFIDLAEFATFYSGSAAMMEVRDAFEVFDKDGDGLISAHELHMVLKSLGEKCTLKDCEKMIQGVDVDGDGFVNFEEFKKMMKDGDGFISAPELHVLKSLQEKCTVKDCEKIIEGGTWMVMDLLMVKL